MTTRSISFSAPMVIALRAGRKTQTRRRVKGTALDWLAPDMFTPAYVAENHACQYGSVGDILKVKEAAWLWCEKVPDGLTPTKRLKYRYVPVQHPSCQTVAYKVDEPERPDHLLRDYPRNGKIFVWRYKLPRYLPAWAVRTHLRITGIRVERLNDISEEDAKAEGAIEWWLGLPHGARPHLADSSARTAFVALWESINGPSSWALNPWVWALEFKIIDGDAKTV